MFVIDCALALSLPTVDTNITQHGEIEGKWALERMRCDGVDELLDYRETAAFHGGVIAGYINEVEVQQSNYKIASGVSTRKIDWRVARGSFRVMSIAGFSGYPRTPWKFASESPVPSDPKIFPAQRAARYIS